MKKIIILLVISILLLQSCKKDMDIMNNDAIKNNVTLENIKSGGIHNTLERNVLHFETTDSLMTAISYILDMTDLERELWEESNNFKSFYSKCNELLEVIDTTNINSINSFINNNSDYFYISEQNGESYLLPYYDESIIMFLLNSHKIISIAGNYYKIFNEGYVVASEDNKDYLYLIDSFNTFMYSDILNYTSTQRAIYDKEVFESIDGKDKLRVVFKIESHPLFYNCASLSITPMHKTLGVWIKCKRSISANVSAEWRYGSYGNFNHTKTGFYNVNNWKTFGIYHDLGFMTSYISGGYFTSISGWADTPSVPVCYCNK